MTIKEMPHVTVEQILALRDAAIKLETERDELLAHVERLRGALCILSDQSNNMEGFPSKFVDDAYYALDETPAKSLEALKKQLRNELAGNLTVALNNTKTWGGSK